MDDASLAYFRSQLEQYGELPASEWDRAHGLIKSIHLEKNDFFIRQGDSPDRLGMAVSGIFRLFCTTETGAEGTLAFRSEGQFLAAFSSFIEKRDAWFSIQALTRGEVLYILLEDFEMLLAEHPCWGRIAREYIVLLFIEKEDRERSFLTEDAKTRYLSFRRKHPEFERHVSQFLIANYLGISPVSLSRIRSELKNPDD